MFFHRGLSSLVAFELKTEKFEPADLGQLSFYIEALDRDVKKPHERPSIGVLLCATKDDEIVEYALARTIFVPHQDSEKADDMFATLVVTLPSEFSRSEIVVQHHEEKVTFRRSGKRLDLIAFYADCHHEVRVALRRRRTPHLSRPPSTNDLGGGGGATINPGRQDRTCSSGSTRAR